MSFKSAEVKFYGADVHCSLKPFQHGCRSGSACGICCEDLKHAVENIACSFFESNGLRPEIRLTAVFVIIMADSVFLQELRACRKAICLQFPLVFSIFFTLYDFGKTITQTLYKARK